MTSERIPTVEDLIAMFGTAKNPGRTPAHARPDGVDDATVEALGKLSAALETVEDARGHLYSFHRLSGRADLDLQEALADLRAAGHAEEADAVDKVLVGRDVVAGMWTFEIVEDYDANYYEAFRSCERTVRQSLGFDEPHVTEAEMKTEEQDS